MIKIERKRLPRFVLSIVDTDGNDIMTMDDIGLEMFATYGTQPEQALLVDDRIRVTVRRA